MSRNTPCEVCLPADIHVDSRGSAGLVSNSRGDRFVAHYCFMRRIFMKTTWLAGFCFLFAAAVCYGADIGVVTIADSGTRVLRGSTWYKLVEGARVQDGDLVDAPERAQVQVELSSGPVLNFEGPMGVLPISAGSREVKSVAEVYLPRGWLKVAVKQGSAPLRVRTASGAFMASDAVAVVHADTDAI